MIWGWKAKYERMLKRVFWYRKQNHKLREELETSNRRLHYYRDKSNRLRKEKHEMES